MKSNSRKKSIPSTILLCLLMAFTSFPLYIMLVGAFKPNASLNSIPVDLNPFTDLTLKSIIQVLEDSGIFLWMKNSFVLALSVAFLTAFIGLFAGYALARINFRGKAFIFATVMATMMMPKQVLMIPNFLVADSLGLVNTMPGVILTSLAPAFSIFLCRQAISSLPNGLLEAAEIDGCSELGKFFKIVLPLALPSAGAAAIFSFFAAFNNYLWQLIMISDKKLQTLSVGIAMFSQTKIANKSLQLACALIASVPLVIIFLLTQKVFIKGATAGAMKG